MKKKRNIVIVNLDQHDIGFCLEMADRTNETVLNNQR